MALIALVSCEVGGKKKMDLQSGPLFPDYRVWAEEESGVVTVRLQFRRGGPEGDPEALPPPASVLFDGEPVPSDSSKMNGIYYELRRPLAEFGGSHSIVYIDPSKNEYRQDFEFPVFSLAAELPATISRDKLTLELAGVKENGVVQVLLTDTSFRGRGIDRYDTVTNNQILLGTEELSELKSGPLVLQLVREEESWLEKGPGGGGILWLNYSLGRELLLKD